MLGRRDGVPEPGARWRDVRLRRHVLQQLRPTLADDAPCVVLAVASLRWVQRGGGGEAGAALFLTTRNGFPGWMAARCSCWTGGALRSLLSRLPQIRPSRGLGMPGGAGGRCERGGAETACSWQASSSEPPGGLRRAGLAGRGRASRPVGLEGSDCACLCARPVAWSQVRGSTRG